jgi:hypothetical protein
MRRLQKKCSEDGKLDVSETDIKKIKQYAAKGQGGWQNFFRALVELIDRSA